MFLENKYVQKNTPIHNLNPIVKFLVFLLIIFLVFLKIDFFIQICLMLLVALIGWQSDCKAILKKSVPLYFGILVFLFTVNFFFMKSPGFWTKNSLLSYKDFMGLVSHTTATSDTVQHGWFKGGEILKGKDGNTFLSDNYSCIETAIGWVKGDGACKDSNHQHYMASSTGTEGVTKPTESRNWKIISLNTNNGTKYVGFLPAWYMISAFQLANAVSISNKIILVIILSSVFSMTCSLPSFTYALEDLFKPFRFIHLPDKVMALAVAISIRFAPSLISEALRIIRAQASRGIDYKNGRFRDKASALLSLSVPLFVISFLKSEELAEAMRARGYDHKQARTSFRVHHITPLELTIFSLTVFFITFLYYLFFNKYFFGLFSNSEYLILLGQ